MTADEIVIGPTRPARPADADDHSSKSDGITPLHRERHGGPPLVLKFDPPGYRGMATGTEVAVTKLMWRWYNVAEPSRSAA